MRKRKWKKRSLKRDRKKRRIVAAPKRKKKSVTSKESVTSKCRGRSQRILPERSPAVPG